MTSISKTNSADNPRSHTPRRFIDLDRDAQQLAITEAREKMRDAGEDSPRWEDASAFHRNYPHLLLDVAVRYDLPPSVAQRLVGECCRNDHVQYGTELSRLLRETETRRPENDRLHHTATLAKWWAQLPTDIFHRLLDAPLDSSILGVALAGIDRRAALNAGLTELVRLIPPPSAEEMARREAQTVAHADALPILQRVNAACDCLKRGEGVSRHPTCGSGNPLAFVSREERGTAMVRPHYCGQLSCPACEAFKRARLLRTALQCCLWRVPDGGVYAAHHQEHLTDTHPAWLTWELYEVVSIGGRASVRRDQARTQPVTWREQDLYTMECPPQSWSAVRARIRRAAREVNAAGVDCRSRPGFIYRRHADGRLTIVTEAPLVQSDGTLMAGARRVRPHEAATIIAEAIGLTAYPAEPRRANDIRFGGRWMPRKRPSRWRRVPCLVSVREARELAKKGEAAVCELPVTGELGAGIGVDFGEGDTAAERLRKFLAEIALEPEAYGFVNFSRSGSRSDMYTRKIDRGETDAFGEACFVGVGAGPIPSNTGFDDL